MFTNFLLAGYFQQYLCWIQYIFRIVTPTIVINRIDVRILKVTENRSRQELMLTHVHTLHHVNARCSLLSVTSV